MIIGITGKKGAGKDSLADEFTRLGFNKIAFAQALKKAAQEIYHLTDKQVFGDISDKETIDGRWGLTPREILQKFGTEVARNIHPETWVMNAMMTIENTPTFGQDVELKWVFSDLRFPNEADAIRKKGGYIVRILRKGNDTGFREDHASETEIDNIAADITVVNNGTLEDLRAVADELLAWIEDDSKPTFYGKPPS